VSLCGGVGVGVGVVLNCCCCVVVVVLLLLLLFFDVLFLTDLLIYLCYLTREFFFFFKKNILIKCILYIPFSTKFLFLATSCWGRKLLKHFLPQTNSRHEVLATCNIIFFVVKPHFQEKMDSP
jgi:hypothetical protein